MTRRWLRLALIGALPVAVVVAVLYGWLDGLFASLGADGLRGQLVTPFALALLAGLALTASLVAGVALGERALLRRLARAAQQAERRARVRAATTAASPETAEIALDRLLRAVGRLGDQRDRVESVLEGMDAAVFAVDEDERITVTNPAMLELFALAGDPAGRHFLEVVPPQVEDCVHEAQAGRSARVEIELPGEQRRIVVAYASPQQSPGRRVANDGDDAGGDPGPSGVAVILRDVTAVRHLERVRRDFVANVSHELRTPVTVIQASAETLLAGALEDPEHARSFVGAIERHAGRLTRIIAGLLDLARLEAGQRGMARERVLLRPAALRALDLVVGPADAKEIEVEIDLPEDLAAFADPKGVDQVLSNLLENAVKYSDAKGHVRVSATVDEASVRVEVADDGPGIKDKHRGRVFERFYRVDKGRSREQGGTGLGLAIVKHLTLAMGGTVGVDPVEPRGSVFWVRLPLAR